MAFSQVAPLRISKMPLAILLPELVRRRTKPTSHYGRKHNLSTSCAGLLLGATVSQDGIANVLLWEGNTLAMNSTFTEAAWTSSSLTMSVR